MAVDFKLDYTAEEINERLGVQPVSMELVWENASPTSEFPAQYIDTDLYGKPLDLSKYDAVEIDCYTKNIPYGSECSRVYKRNPIQPHFTTIFGMSDGSISYGNFRGETLSDTSIAFTDSYTKTFTGTTRTVDNGVLIPYRIYGIKGIK